MKSGVLLEPKGWSNKAAGVSVLGIPERSRWDPQRKNLGPFLLLEDTKGSEHQVPLMYIDLQQQEIPDISRRLAGPGNWILKQGPPDLQGEVKGNTPPRGRCGSEDWSDWFKLVTTSGKLVPFSNCLQCGPT